jgi:hypothetical protein
MKAITKDYFREIKSRKGQFISMFLIVFIGAAFFSGIRSGKSAMEYTINRYFVDNKFMDIQVVSTVGLDDDDIDKIEDIKGIKKVHPSYSIEAFNDQGTVSYVMKVLAYEKGVNTPIIKEGRNIKSKKECLIDEDYAITAGIDIGDKIKLEADGDKKIKETLKYEEYEVVGIVNHPMYLSIDRGASSIGNGSVDYFMILHRDVFKLDVYTDAYITIDDIEKLAPYKLYIFRDAFLYRPQLRKFLEENNASALWLGPAGCVTENSIDFSLAEKQTTFKLKHAHQVVAPNTVTCHGEHFLNKGLTLPATPSGVEDINALWTPVLYAEADSASQVAGLVESLDLPGLISRKSGNRFDVWSSSPLLFQETLRNLAIAAGVNLRVLEGKAEIYGAGKTFAIHVKSDSPIVLQANNNLINLITDEVYPAIDNKVTINEPSGRVLLLRD